MPSQYYLVSLHNQYAFSWTETSLMQSTDQYHRFVSWENWHIHRPYSWATPWTGGLGPPSVWWQRCKHPFAVRYPTTVLQNLAVITLASSSQSSFSSRSFQIHSISTFFLWLVMTSFWILAPLFIDSKIVFLPVSLDSFLLHTPLIFCGISVRSDLDNSLRCFFLDLLKEAYI